MHKKIDKKPCNDIHMKVLVKNASYGTCLFFTQNNYITSAGTILCFAQYALRFFFLRFKRIKGR
jgi:hypothetical protein